MPIFSNVACSSRLFNSAICAAVFAVSGLRLLRPVDVAEFVPQVVVRAGQALLVERHVGEVLHQRLAELELQIPPPDQQSPQALHALQEAEIKKWWPIVRAAGLKPE